MAMKHILKQSGAMGLALAVLSVLAPADAVAQVEAPQAIESAGQSAAPERVFRSEPRRSGPSRRTAQQPPERQAADDSGVDQQRAAIRERVRDRLRERRVQADRPVGDAAEPTRNRTYVDPSRDAAYRGSQSDTDRGWGERGVDRQRVEIDRRLREQGIDRQTGMGDRARDGQWRSDRNRDWRDRDGQWRNDRERAWRGRDGQFRHDGRWGHGDSGWRDGRGWNRHAWRNDRRYDWHRHRSLNRHLFRPGRYLAPHWNYQYNRLGIGIRLGSSFYGSRYWISDPWRYRLPEVYGPYRWVRYYDDVLLVDIYSGEVVDVIHDFFW